MKSKGFTLIELAVVLAIIAVLAAILTPMVTGYLDQARIARAQADIRTIADSLKLHQRDTGRYPIYGSAADFSSNTVGSGSPLLAGPGTSPSNLAAFWAGTTIATSSLESWINGNFSVVGTNTFPKAGFRGPYVASIETDPWGNRYLLTAGYLATATNHAFVISAGPNGTLETAYTQPASGVFSVGSDDVVSVIK